MLGIGWQLVVFVIVVIILAGLALRLLLGIGRRR